METLAQPGFAFTLLAFLGVIGVLVFVHEMGHYLAARALGIRVEVFSVGFGREIAGFTDRRGTRWKLGWLPLGGYAKFAGDMNAASQPDPSLVRLPEAERRELFQFRPVGQRALVVAAGPAINFAFAILLFAAFFLAWGRPVTMPVVGQVVPASPAAEAGLVAGDRLLAIDGQRVRRFEDVQRIVSASTGQPMRLEVERQTRRLELVVRPQLVEERDPFGGSYTIARVGLLSSGERALERLGPVRAIGAGISETWAMTRLMVVTLGQVVTGQRGLDELGGPVKIAQYSGQSASLGLAALVGFVALVSINLGFINLLPVPMLDGGHLMLYAIEAARRRPVSPRVQEWAFVSGFALLVSLMLLLTWNDMAGFGLWRPIGG